MGEELSLVENKSFDLQNILKAEQDTFLKNTLSKVINTAVDVAIKSVLPDWLEDQAINIKDAVIEKGFKKGVDTAIENAVDTGKSMMGIVTGKFDNANQVEIALKKGGIVESVSNLIDTNIKKAKENGKINKDTAKELKEGKNEILKSITDRIEDTLKTQVKNVEKIETYSQKWKEAYEARDFQTMDKKYKLLKKYLDETIPLENTINEARRIENLHNLIKNNGQDFNISEEELRLAEKL